MDKLWVVEAASRERAEGPGVRTKSGRINDHHYMAGSRPPPPGTQVNKGERYWCGREVRWIEKGSRRAGRPGGLREAEGEGEYSGGVSNKRYRRKMEGGRDGKSEAECWLVD